jgi:hypothetical protein
MKEDKIRASPDKSISSPLISRTESSERDSLSSRDSLPTSDSKLDNVLNNNTIQNNTNSRSDERTNASVKRNCKIDDELNNNTAQNESIDRFDTQTNAYVDADINNNIDQSPLEPIDLNLSMKFVSVSLNEKISVKTGFHNVGDVQFSLMIYFKKMEIFYRVGDFHPGRGFFACCGYLENNLENLNLFFVDENFVKPSNVSYIYYLKKKIVPTHRLNQKVTIML